MGVKCILQENQGFECNFVILEEHARRSELEADGFCMKVVENRRERYPNLLERSKWAQKGPKTEQRILERYT